MLTTVQLIFSLAMILFGAELFTNAVEWLGRKLGLGQGAVGSVLAAIGTALPETAVPVTAILFGGGSKEAEQVGIGGILGAPFLLATLGSLVMALALVGFRSGGKQSSLVVNERSYRRDFLCFFSAYALAIIAGLFPSVLMHKTVPIALVLIYVLFIWRSVRDKSDKIEEDELKPLYIQRKSDVPTITLVFVQLFIALALIVGGAHILTGQVEQIAVRLGLPTFVLSALIIPLATELPETLNSVVWIRQGKDHLAIGNISGAMVFQSTLVPALGISMTPWSLTPDAILTAVLTMIAALFTFMVQRATGALQPWALMTASSFYFILPMQTMAARYQSVNSYLIFGGVIVILLASALWSKRRRAVS